MWQRFRAAFLAANPLCVLCEAQGKVVPATEVDHVRAVTGPEDTALSDPANWRGLCKACHSRKTVQTDHGFGR
jgi:5-methylcytosine-specific restriction protein A